VRVDACWRPGAPVRGVFRLDVCGRIGSSSSPTPIPCSRCAHAARAATSPTIAPGPLKQAIEARTGPINAVRIATAGQNSPLAAIIDIAEGRLFAKGLPSGHRQVITQAREAAVGPLVRGSHRPCCGTSTKQVEDRWKPYVDDPASPTLFAGSALTHSDWTPDDVLVSPGRAWLIDWAWPTLGAGWTDPACWILRLMASGGRTARGRAASLPPPSLPGGRPRARRPVRRSQRPAMGRERAVEHQRLDGQNGACCARLGRPPPDPSDGQRRDLLGAAGRTSRIGPRSLEPER
jgi:hypothetical protein